MLFVGANLFISVTTRSVVLVSSIKTLLVIKIFRGEQFQILADNSFLPWWNITKTDFTPPKYGILRLLSISPPTTAVHPLSVDITMPVCAVFCEAI